MVYPHISQLVQIFIEHGIDAFFIAPGSRSAPLTLAVARHPQAKTFVFNDERSCAYAALGFAQQRGRASAVICTSGTAAINLYPAVAEAYFLEVPLVVLTADRPPEWIGQQDGQAIFQQNLYGSHVKQSWQLPVHPTHVDEFAHTLRIANEAALRAHDAPLGPVHINVPLREPLYPKAGESITFEKQRIIEVAAHQTVTPKSTVLTLVKRWLSCDKKLIVVGQHAFDKDLNDALYACNYYLNTPVLADITANLNGVARRIVHADVILRGNLSEQAEYLKPELLLTVGKGILSKNLKKFLRTYKPKEHWHLQEAGPVADVFQSLSLIIRHSAADFITKIGETGYFEQKLAAGSTYDQWWHAADTQLRQHIEAFAQKAPLSDLSAVFHCMKHLPERCILHLSNSMPVRYAQLCSFLLPAGVKVFANRGTSGIDGCTSTAIGAALATSEPVFLITGDVAALYDSNAFWMEAMPKNFKMLVLNNGGGNIFGIIDGPSELPECSRYFESHQPLNCRNLAHDYQLAYHAVHSQDELLLHLAWFTRYEGACILEVFTDKQVNKAVLNEMYASISIEMPSDIA